MDDSVVVDAKRILLRYGAPIAVVEKIPSEDQISFARSVARTTLAQRETELKRLLVDRGYMKAG